MAEIGNVAVTVGANVSGFVAGMQTAANSTETLNNRIRASIGTFGAYAGAAAAGGAALIAGLYQSAAETIDQQAKLARAVGASTAGFQGLAYAADLAGVNQEALAAASGKLNVKIGEAIQNGGASAAAFERLGLSVKDLANMDADQRFAVIADRIKGLGMDSTTAGAALKEMGLKGEEMRQFMLDGGEQIRQASQDLRDFGVSLNDVETNKVEAANDAISRIGLVSKGVGNQIAVGLSPYIQVIAQRLADAAKGSHGFRDAIQDAIKTGVEWSGKLANVIHGLHVVLKAIEVAVSFVGESFVTVFAAASQAVAESMDGVVGAVNIAISASNTLLGTQQDLFELPSKSALMEGIGLAAEVAQDNTKRLRKELEDLAAQPLPSDGVTKFLNDVAAQADASANTVKQDRAGSTGTNVGQSKDDIAAAKKAAAERAKHDQTVGDVMQGLTTGTAAMQAEYDKRQQVLAIYRANTLAADAPYYAQQLTDIQISEAVKAAELESAYAKDLATREAHKADALAKIGTDRAAIAAVIAQYDAQDILAEQIKQDQLTAVQADAEKSRAKLRETERQHAIGVALGLGQQLMGVAQGHSKKAFEFAKTAAIVSATIDGYRSATAAWSAGMSVGGPWAPAVAAAYTASSLLRTGAMIQGIRGTSFNGGGGGGAGAVSGGGGSISAAPAAAGGGSSGPAAGPQSGNVQRVSFAGDFFSGSAVEKIAKGLVQYQKDGGQVVFAS